MGRMAAPYDGQQHLRPWCFRLGLEKFEKKLGDQRFNDPANVEKNRALNENILKRLKQIVVLVM